jgi:PKD-like domain/Secretion system C-terminal sorting domain
VSGNSACTISGSTTLPTVTIRLASYFYGKVTLSVKAKNACGTSLPRTVILSDEPAAPVSISGPSSVSKNQSNLAYQVPYTPGLTYYWSVDGGTITSKPAPYKIIVKWGRYNGTVKVKVRNNCGYSPLTEKTITVGSSNHDIEIENTANPVTQKSYIQAYPNPATGNATIVFNSINRAKKYKMEVHDLSGKLITAKTGATSEGINMQRLDVSKYAGSMYVVTISVEGELPRIVKLFKVN